MTEKLRTIRLYGKLGAKFGRIHRYVCHDTASALRAMCAMVPNFGKELMESKDKGIAYACFIGKENIGEDALSAPAGSEDIRIAPVIIGSGRGFQLIGGVILAGVGLFTGNPYLVAAGVGMAIGGAAQYFTSISDGNTGVDSADNGASYNFNGPVNVTAQGNPVPTLYGEMIVGSVTVSGDIYSEDQQ